MQLTRATSLCTVLGFGLVLALAARPAAAQTTESHIGVGFQSLAGGNFSGAPGLTLLPGVQGVFDSGPWHIDGTLGFASGDNTSLLQLGGAFWFHLHQSTASDFSLGGGLGFASFSTKNRAATTRASSSTSARRSAPS